MKYEWVVGQYVARESYAGTLISREKLVSVGVRKLKTDAGNQYRSSDGRTHNEAYAPRIVPWTRDHTRKQAHFRVKGEIRRLMEQLLACAPTEVLEELEGNMESALCALRGPK